MTQLINATLTVDQLSATVMYLALSNYLTVHKVSPPLILGPTYHLYRNVDKLYY